MTNKRHDLAEGYIPQKVDKGYQPAKQGDQSSPMKPDGGYQPEKQSGTQSKPPPGKE
ncbi:MAG TPA: hypothetical protein VGH80_00405 [Xanthomonadaceae bacterium]|jgi:hypothetical protein